MKLKHRGTGNWGEPLSTSGHNIMVREYACRLGKTPYVDHHYDSLEKLNTEWEDYEKPDEYWTVDCGVATRYSWDDEKYDRDIEAVGLKFDTKEECERAIEKMKAWRRLKEARFEFTDFGYNLEEESSSIIGADGKICFRMLCHEDFADDLELLFGGEEC